MRSARNIPCSQAGLPKGQASDGELLAWRRIRRAVDGYAPGIVRVIGESYGKETVQHAWREFTVGGGSRFLGDDPNAELFFS